MSAQTNWGKRDLADMPKGYEPIKVEDGKVDFGYGLVVFPPKNAVKFTDGTDTFLARIPPMSIPEEAGTNIILLVNDGDILGDQWQKFYTYEGHLL